MSDSVAIYFLLAEKILNKQIWISCHGWGKYPRTITTVYENAEDMLEEKNSINQWLIDNNFAYEYDGRKKKSFSEWYSGKI